jgi:hypothetical protein
LVLSLKVLLLEHFSLIKYLFYLSLALLFW